MCLRSRTARLRFGRGSTLALLAGFAVASSAAPAHALVTTLLSSEAHVSGSLSDPDESWSDSDQSTDLAPSISVSQSFSTNTSSNSFVQSGHAVSVGRLRISTRSTAGAGGAESNGDAAHDFEIRFSIDEAAYFELKNGNSTGSFPSAQATSSSSASLVYELRREGAVTPVFTYSPPPSNGAGVYRSGIITAGTYVWTCSGIADANGTEGETQSAAAIGNTTLQLDPAPVSEVPLLGPVGAVALFAGLGRFALARLRRI